MYVRIEGPVTHNGQRVEFGTVLELDERTGRRVVAAGFGTQVHNPKAVELEQPTAEQLAEIEAAKTKKKGAARK